MAHLNLRLLGPPEFTLDGQPLAGLASNKVRALLTYLAVQTDLHRRETLAGLLWPDYPERSARTNLSNALSNLRTAIADREATLPFLDVSREAIQFNAGSDCWVDALALEELVEREQWSEAVELYRGPFLDGFSLPDSPAFEQWVVVTHERLQRQVMAALDRLTVECEEHGHYARACEAARRQLEIEPWYEGAHRALMRALALSGERASALAQYEACARTLKRELDVAPSAETKALYEDIRDGKVAPSKEAPTRRPDEVTAVSAKGATAPVPTLPTGERRWVTALHAEVNQAAALLDEVGPEEWIKAIARVLDVAEGEIQRYGGEVIQRREEAVVALFGVPAAHEDDAERAVLAALGMQARMPDAPELRIGVDTGEVLVTHAGDRRQVVGRALTLARRTSVAADPGTVLVGENAYRIVGPLFEWEALGGQATREMYRPLARVALSDKGRGIEGLSSPLVGRGDEFRALSEALERLCSGIGGIVTLVGEAGIGKSRLVAEVQRSAVGGQRSGDLRWVEGRCLSYATSVAYQVWLDMLRQVLGAGPDVPPTAVREALRERVRALCPEHYNDVYPYLCRLLSLPLEDAYEMVRSLGGESLRAEIFDAVATLIEGAARQAPLVLVCEDLHWADPTSLALLERVLPLVDRVPLLLLCVFRPETERGCWQIKERAAREYRHRHIDLWLDPLNNDESAALVGNLLHVEDLPGSLSARILDRAQGNPLYVEEILRSLIDDQAIVYNEHSGHWQVAHPVDDIALPGTLHAMLAARIDRLQTETKRVLQLASVIGRMFTYPLLSEIATALPLLRAGDLDAHLLVLQREQLIRERARVPEREYIFQHVLMQEAAHSSLLKGERRRYHRQAAEALEHLFPDRVEEQLGLLAHHRERAEEPSRAVEYLLRAGDQARGAYANEEAIDYYRRALALLEEPSLAQARPEWRLAALQGLGIAYFGIGRVNEAEPLLQEAAAMGKEMGIALRDLVRIYYWLGEALWWQGRHDERLRIGEEGLALLGDDTESLEAALMNQTIAFSAQNQDMLLNSTFRTSEFIQRIPYTEELRPAYDHIILACIWTKNVDEAMRWAHILKEKAALHHDLRGVAEAYGELGTISAERGNLHEAISYHRQALGLYVRMGDTGHKGWSLRDIARAFLALGDLQNAEEHVRKSLEIAKIVGFKRDVKWTYWGVGWVLLCRNDWQEAARYFQVALDLDHKFEREWMEGWAEYSMGRAYLAQGNDDGAAESFQEAINLMGPQEMRAHPLEFAAALSSLEQASRDTDAFRAFCHRFQEEHPETGELPFVQWYLEPAMAGAFRQAPLHEDSFVGDLSPEWEWHDPFGDCSCSSRNGLELCAANRRDLWHINWSAPRVLRSASGDLAIQTTCVPVSDDRPAIGGLLLWMDKRNYLRLDRGVLGPRDVSLMGCLDNEDVVIGRGRLPGDSESTILRLERVDDQVNAFCSADGEQWFTVGHTAFPTQDPIQVGLHAIGNIDRRIYHGAYPEGTAIRFGSFQLWQEGK